MSFDDDLTACAQLVERGDPDRFAAAMAAPVAARRVLFPLYAFNVEVSRAPWVTQEAMIAEMRLQWWKDALEEIRTSSSVRRHEVVTPLSNVIDAEAAAGLEALVAARQWDIYRDPFEDEAQFARYIEDTSANLMVAGARALGATETGPLVDLGYANGLANFFRAVPQLEQHGRRPLVDGRPEAVEVLATDALMRLRRARKARARLSPEARPVALAAWQAEPLLKQAKADPRRVADGTLGLSEAGKKTRLIWQAATGRW